MNSLNLRQNNFKTRNGKKLADIAYVGGKIYRGNKKKNDPN